MDTLLTGNVWRQVATKANAAKRRLAAVAYVHNDGHLKLRRNDVLICDASDRAIRAGETSARLLETLYRRSVEIRSRRDLHAKVAVFGRFALIGSMNLSGSAANILTELALFTDRKQIVSQATAFVHQIRENSQKVNNQFLRRILGIKVRRTPRYRGRYKAPPRLGDRAWFVSAREVSDESFPDESGLVEKAEKKATLLLADKDATISWIRLIGRSRVRSHARPGDIFVQILESESGKRVSVYEPVRSCFDKTSLTGPGSILPNPIIARAFRGSNSANAPKSMGSRVFHRIVFVSSTRVKCCFLRGFGSRGLPNQRVEKDAADRASHPNR